MPQKNSIKVKKQEKLPSFLRDLTSHNLDRVLKLKQRNFHSNPIFFGECKQFHSVPHSVFLGGLSYPSYSKISDENIYPDLFLPKDEPTEKAPAAEPVKNRYRKKHTKEFIDQYPHRCPGARKAFVPRNEVFTPDLGETTSEIESDTWREIPFCRVKSTLIESPEPKVENVMLSDMKEKNRTLLPYEQRMAHNHFPKEFISVKLVGPIIPASITITKIPSKRKRVSDFAFEVIEEKVDKMKSNAKTAKKTNEKIEKGEEEEAGEKEIEEEEGGEEEEQEEEQEEQEEEQEEEEKEEEGEEKEKEEGADEEEKEEPTEEKVEETGEPNEGEEAGEALENGTEIASTGTVLQENEEKANAADNGENIEDDKE